MGEEASVSTVRLGPKQLTIPSGWKELTLGEINGSEQPICYGVLKPGPDHEEGIPLIKIEDIEDGFLESGQDFHLISEGLSEDFSRSVLQGGEVLISIQGTVGRVAVVPPGLAGANISRTVGRMTPHEVNALWLKYCLESKDLQDYISILSSGSTRASYNIGDIRTTAVPVPPFEEQRRIASVLYTVDQLFQKSIDTEKSLTRLKRGLIQELFSNEWPTRRLGSVCQVDSGTSWSKSQEVQEPTEDAVQVVAIPNVQDGFLDLEDERYVKGLSAEVIDKYTVEEDSLLMIGSSGSADRVGHCGYVEQDLDMVFASFLYRLRPVEERVLPRFLFYTLNRRRFQRRLTSLTVGSTSLKNLNKGEVESLRIPTPDVEDQRKIVEFLTVIDDRMRIVRKNRNRVRRLKRGLIQDLLTGEVRTDDVDIEIPDQVAAYG